MRVTKVGMGLVVVALVLVWTSGPIEAQRRGGFGQRRAAGGPTQGQVLAADPGVRGGAAGAGGFIDGLSLDEQAYFAVGTDDFEEAEGVGDGLGPRFNLDSCAGCHSQPATGGSSPPSNPQVTVATAFGARNRVPSFITPNGPVREVRYRYHADGSRDGGVHALFVVSGRVDDTGNADACNIRQEDFELELARDNVIFRIPTPTFGAGLIEQIQDRAVVANQGANASAKQALGIRGRPNRTGNDGTITRFGWKGQNKLAIFSGEAHNVEMGITNEPFPNERDESPQCQFATVPNDRTATNGGDGAGTISAVAKFSLFMRFLAPPTPVPSTPSTVRGRQLFTSVGCGLCHTPVLRTGPSGVGALSERDVNLFSDLLVHAMGPGLADDIVQGAAGPDEFRTAPLWGLGQRIFFLHDGRTTDLVEAIRAHRSAGNRRFGPSEANRVIDRYNGLGEQDKQDLPNFLRSL
jgi:CxxC motif-containing protein (DUF1111 family)